MPSFPPLFSGFRQRNRRYEQPREGGIQVRQTFKAALLKLLPRSCSANERRREEAEQMMRDDEHEQEMTRVTQRAEVEANELERTSDIESANPLQEEEVIISEDDMNALAEELEPGCTDSKHVKDTEKDDEGALKQGNTEGDEVVRSETGNSVDNFDMEDIERLEREESDKSKGLTQKPTSTSGSIHQNEVPKTATSPVRIMEQNVENKETHENVNHHLNPFYMYQEPIARDSTESVTGPSNAASTYPTTAIPPNEVLSTTQVLQNIANAWGVNETWGPATLATDAPPPSHANAIAGPSFIPASTPNSGWGPPPTEINEAPPPYPENIPANPQTIVAPTLDETWGPPINEANLPYPSFGIPKPSLCQASTFLPSSDDPIEDLFRDMRSFVPDVEAELQRVADMTQKRQELLAERIHSLQIELRGRQQNSGIKELLQIIAKYEKSNVELSKFLHEVVERVARECYGSG